eukprot:6161255-Prorocentrum_lima.AAC.1
MARVWGPRQTAGTGRTSLAPGAARLPGAAGRERRPGCLCPPPIYQDKPSGLAHRAEPHPTQ